MSEGLLRLVAGQESTFCLFQSDKVALFNFKHYVERVSATLELIAHAWLLKILIGFDAGLGILGGHGNLLIKIAIGDPDACQVYHVTP